MTFNIALTLNTLEAHFRKAWSCPHISSPDARSWIRSPPRSPNSLSTYLPKLQKFGYALEPSANTANRTLLRGPKLSMDAVSVALPTIFYMNYNLILIDLSLNIDLYLAVLTLK